MGALANETGQNGLLDPDASLFALARRGKYLPPWYVAIPMTIVFIVVFSLALQGLFNLLNLTSGITTLINSPDVRLSGLGVSISLMIGNGAIMLLVAAWVKWVEKRAFWTIGLKRKGALVKYLRGILLGVGGYVVVIGILTLTGSVSAIQGTPGQVGLGALVGVLLVLPGWMIQAAREEVVTRGWLLPTQGARYKPWIGIALSAGMFTLLHLPDFLSVGFNPIAVLSGLSFSVLMAVYALYEGSLWGVFGFHAAWNWAEGNVLATQVSGNAIPGGALVKLASTGPAWLTGGTWGPEASLPVLALLLVGIAMVLWLAHRRRAQARIGAESPSLSSPA
jgi:membrane protease YdiL (CAAX protease family)